MVFLYHVTVVLLKNNVYVLGKVNGIGKHPLYGIKRNKQIISVSTVGLQDNF